MAQATPNQSEPNSAEAVLYRAVVQLHNQVLEVEATGWDPKYIAALKQSLQELDTARDGIAMPSVATLIERISALLSPSLFAHTSLSTAQTERLLESLHELQSHLASRFGHEQDLAAAPLKHEHYTVAIALQDPKLAKEISQQLQYFGYHIVIFEHLDKLIAAAQKGDAAHAPYGVMILDIEYCNPQIQPTLKMLSDKIPIIVFSDKLGVQTRLLAVQSGSDAFLVPPVELTTLIDKIDHLTTPENESPPFRILIVEDSKTHASFIAKELKQQNMIVDILIDPIQINDRIFDFRPDLILLDFYMPICSGPELAKVIRQQDQFVGIPIVYLSAEEDATKQLDAIKGGGDDFLTKPVPVHQLISVVTARAQRSRVLRAEMIRDSLTGLLNHTRILEQLDIEMARARRHHTSLCYVMIDIDHFKSINDTHGHNMGDKIIQGLARLLKQRLRKTDSVGRYGGEEFAVIMPVAGLDDVENIINKIRESFSKLLYRDHDTHKQFFATFSAGAAMYDDSMKTVDEFVQAADKALYQAKGSGRNCVVKYTSPK